MAVLWPELQSSKYKLLDRFTIRQVGAFSVAEFGMYLEMAHCEDRTSWGGLSAEDPGSPYDFLTAVGPDTKFEHPFPA